MISNGQVAVNYVAEFSVIKNFAEIYGVDCSETRQVAKIT